ncbi:MAG: hypothetical protein SVZ03_12285 [Spirochaetota bacterium]|nr:hypothetical protein [Spirochaetota bacterium]
MKKLLGEMLIENRILTHDQIAVAIEIQNNIEQNPIGVILNKLGYVNKDTLALYLRKQAKK